jgi:large subunit ribosomal protein L21
MYAIVEIAGLQYKVQKDQRVYVHRLAGNEGDKLTFDRVMLAEDKKGITVGAPVIEGASVTASILSHVKADKVIIFKKKRRKGYDKKTGHRQPMTQIVISDIKLSAPKKKATKKAEATEEVAAEA